MRRHGYSGNALIESLHTVQESFGYLDERALRFVTKSLRTPLSKAYGVATFYHFFSLKPPGAHTCVVCMGTACYIKGAPRLLDAIQKRFAITDGETTSDRQLSLLTACCLGSCGLAPAVVLDGDVVGRIDTAELLKRAEGWTNRDT
jgi:bidirectional [NiFe] hydrogenase diaphorase subunit